MDKKIEKLVKQHISDNKEELVKNGIPVNAIDWLTKKSIGKEISSAIDIFLDFEYRLLNHVIGRYLNIAIEDNTQEEDLAKYLSAKEGLDINSNLDESGNNTVTVCFEGEKIYSFKRGIDIDSKKAFFEVIFHYAENE